MSKKEITKQDRIKKEEARVRNLYKDIGENENKIIDGLIQRAAYMRIALEEYEKDLDENGYIEMFTQSERTDPYERERPVARLYNAMNKNYQSIMKQLSDFIAKTPAKTEADGFDEFVSDRND